MHTVPFFGFCYSGATECKWLHDNGTTYLGDLSVEDNVRRIRWDDGDVWIRTGPPTLAPQPQPEPTHDEPRQQFDVSMMSDGRALRQKSALADSTPLDTTSLPNTKNCPACHIPTGKNGGCDHMTCTCGHHWHWPTLRPLNAWGHDLSPGPVPPPSLACSTWGCKRFSWKSEASTSQPRRAYADACCRTCTSSGGRSHGPTCDRRHLERVNAYRAQQAESIFTPAADPGDH